MDCQSNLLEVSEPLRSKGRGPGILSGGSQTAQHAGSSEHAEG